MSTATLPAPAIQGRWGWYAIDYPTFRQIKEFHKLLYRDRRATKRRQRWHAKLPSHRVGPEPKCLGTNQATYAWVLTEYRRLRRPSPTPETIPSEDLPTDWQQRHAKLAEFYSATQPITPTGIEPVSRQ